MKLSDTAKEVIRLAEAGRAYWDRELPKRHPDYPWIRSGEDSGPPPPEQKQLETFLKNLPEEQVYALLLVMYLGRGDYGTAPFEESYRGLRDAFETPELAISQMMEKRSLGEYLADGLEQLHEHGVDVDRLGFLATSTSPHGS